MLKILHIIPSLRKGGAERLALDICLALQKLEDIQVKLISFSELNDYAFLTETIDWVVIPSNVNLSIKSKNKYNIKKLQSAIEIYSPDVIHTHLFEAEIVSRSCHYPNAKWFTHCHDNMVQFEPFRFKHLFNKQKLTNYFEKRYLFKQYKRNGGTRFIAISKDTESYFLKNAKPYAVHLLHNAIDVSRFTKPKTFNKEKKCLQLINVGSFVKKKNQTFLLDVAAMLSKKELDFDLHLLGDGPLLEMNKQKVVKYGLENCIHFHGNVNNVEEYLWYSDIYLHSASYEPLGLVLLEAMAAGLPVITLDGKGNRDLIVDGENGYMIFEENSELFAQKIIDLWPNLPLYKLMSKKAQQHTRTFDIEQYANTLLAIYQKN